MVWIREERRLECIFRVCINGRIRNRSIEDQEILKALNRRDILIMKKRRLEMLRRWWGVSERENIVEAGGRRLKRGKVLGRIGEDRRIITVRRVSEKDRKEDYNSQEGIGEG